MNMKSLKPSTIVTVGPALLAVGSAVGFWFALPDSRTVRGVGWSLLIGGVFGLAIFGPMAAAWVLRQRHPDWLFRHAFRIQWYTSAAMGLSLGYLIACLRHSIFDTVASFASLVVFLGAVTKSALGDALHKDSKDAG
jgi:hypothetical protein